MFEARSAEFRAIFDRLGVQYHMCGLNQIEQSHVLRVARKSLGVYFNDATSVNPAYFAVNRHWYAGFRRDPHWVDAPGSRIEKPSYWKWIPAAGHEEAAIRSLCEFAAKNL